MKKLFGRTPKKSGIFEGESQALPPLEPSKPVVGAPIRPDGPSIPEVLILPEVPTPGRKLQAARPEDGLGVGGGEGSEDDDDDLGSELHSFLGRGLNSGPPSPREDSALASEGPKGEGPEGEGPEGTGPVAYRSDSAANLTQTAGKAGGVIPRPRPVKSDAQQERERRAREAQKAKRQKARSDERGLGQQVISA